MQKSRSQFLMLIFGGVLPVVAFAIVEDKYGVIWGTIAGMIFGVGEVLYEKIKLKKVSGITWFSNFLVLVLGGLSLISEDGIWFKMQPAIFLFTFASILLGSSLLKKPLLLAMAAKQNPNLPEAATQVFGAMNTRLSFVFFALGGLAAWAALYWSTEAWAFLKSVGILILLGLYMAGEILYRRFFTRRFRG